MSNCEAKTSLEQDLSCPVCKCIFSEPVTLPCGHTFCEICLEKAGTSLSQEAGWHYCSECKKGFPGLGTLPKNFILCSIIESYKNGLGNTTFSSLPRTQQQRGRKEPDIQTDYCTSTDVVSDEGQKDIVLPNVSTSPQLENIKVGVKIEPKSVPSLEDSALKHATNEGRIKLCGLAKDLQLKLATTEVFLHKETEKQTETQSIHDDVREKFAGLLQQMSDLIEKYTITGMELIEVQLRPKEEAMDKHVTHVSDFHSQLKEAQHQATVLLEEQDEVRFSQGLLTVEPLIAKLVGVPLHEMAKKAEATYPNLAGTCVELEHQNVQLRVGLSSTQRALRNFLNPSEVTFDPDTVHPNLVLSEDLKTVTFSPTKQPYPLQAKRFSSLFQVLSSQSFGESFGVAGGEHCWELQLENCSWVVGVCYEGLPRSGPGSALESIVGCWCLMYHDNRLRAYDKTQATELKRTTSLRRVQIRVSFKNQSVSFYSISNIDATKMHLHTCQVAFTEPIHLAIRMMSGQSKACITVR